MQHSFCSWTWRGFFFFFFFRVAMISVWPSYIMHGLVILIVVWKPWLIRGKLPHQSWVKNFSYFLRSFLLSATVQVSWLEVNKCAFTFSSEIRQIQCTRTEFWCVQCPRPAGPSALDKHQIQASALDLSYFTSKSKCKFINLIHTWQKNKIICSRLWKIINKMVLKCH